MSTAYLELIPSWGAIYAAQIAIYSLRISKLALELCTHILGSSDDLFRRICYICMLNDTEGENATYVHDFMELKSLGVIREANRLPTHVSTCATFRSSS